LFSYDLIKRSFLILGFSPFVMAGCSSLKDEVLGGKNVGIPTVSAECKRADECGFYGIVFWTEKRCLEELEEFKTYVAYESFEYAEEDCNSETCQKDIETWIDADGFPILTVPSGTYTLCVAYDFNGDGLVGTEGDVYGEIRNIQLQNPADPQEVKSFKPFDW
jgi:hypothetical protein